MAWEDGNVESVMVLIDAADKTSSKSTKLNTLNQALSSAKCIRDTNKRNSLVRLIEDKINEL